MRSISTLEKWSIVLLSALKRETRQERFQLAGALGKNRGQQFFSRDTDEAFRRRLLGTVLAEVFADHLHTDIAGRPFLAVELDRSQTLQVRQMLSEFLRREPFLLVTGIDVPKTF